MGTRQKEVTLSFVVLNVAQANQQQINHFGARFKLSWSKSTLIVVVATCDYLLELASVISSIAILQQPSNTARLVSCEKLARPHDEKMIGTQLIILLLVLGRLKRVVDFYLRQLGIVDSDISLQHDWIDFKKEKESVSFQKNLWVDFCDQNIANDTNISSSVPERPG